MATWVATIKDWATTDTPTGALLNQEVRDRLTYLRDRKPEFQATTDEGKHLEYGQTTVTVTSGQSSGTQAATFNTAFVSVTPTPKASAESVDTGAWFGFVMAISSTSITLASRHYQDTAAGSNKSVPVNWVVVG